MFIIGHHVRINRVKNKKTLRNKGTLSQHNILVFEPGHTSIKRYYISNIRCNSNHLTRFFYFQLDDFFQSVKVRSVLAQSVETKNFTKIGIHQESWCRLSQSRIACPGGGIGRHKGFKIPRRSRCAGSSPARGTMLIREAYLNGKPFFIFLTKRF